MILVCFVVDNSTLSQNQPQFNQKEMSSILDVDAVVEWDQLDKKRFLMWGALFTCTLDSTLHPFEVVKTRLQVQGQVGLYES
jgi:hypothetical protein